MVVFPPCKINLGLHILSKREDGYHNLETCFYPIPWTDILEIVRSDKFEFSFSGLLIPRNSEGNLCIRAYQLLKKEFEISAVKIHLHKIIPMGAGLGGGSSNAAYTLRLLNQIFELNISTHKLKELAAHLGSDCAFFIQDQPMIGSGRGEVLSPAAISLKGFFLVLVKPQVHVSTAEAYAGINLGQHSISISTILSQPIDQWKEKLSNDFEKSIFKKFPVIEQVKEKMYQMGATYVSMSGSGASVFAIFNKPVDYKNEFLGMDYWSGELK
ncbi:MAG TPA: 4-(cytidine 5'-diphospho)-2-C-methyl-D-erythritol kinase [Cytophagales bacterium]|jgi:4-diphosphocytidyl-2-C-methyl-D-erythritol kinase|nr:4-(cytidine 5'-diphospho)-2-C-methyl-D-erythritol kinase [Cytophagales bacterium]